MVLCCNAVIWLIIPYMAKKWWGAFFFPEQKYKDLTGQSLSRSTNAMLFIDLFSLQTKEMWNPDQWMIAITNRYSYQQNKCVSEVDRWIENRAELQKNTTANDQVQWHILMDYWIALLSTSPRARRVQRPLSYSLCLKWLLLIIIIIIIHPT